MATEFPQVWVWPALHFNELVVGLSEPIPPVVARSATDGDAGRTSRCSVRSWSRSAYVAPPSQDPLTDDRAPVEWLTDRAILAYIAGGGVLDEHLLPTAP